MGECGTARMPSEVFASTGGRWFPSLAEATGQCPTAGRAGPDPGAVQAD
jgi:hypothetical protein